MSTHKKDNMADQNYNKLAQLDCLRRFMSTKQETLENILSGIDNINYQIPANDFFKLKKPNWIGNTALQIALDHDDTEVFSILLKRGADLTIKNNNGESVLHRAIEFIFKNPKSSWEVKQRFNCSFIKLILSAHVDLGISINPTNKYGLSHFHIACLMDDVKAIEFFLKNGVSVNHAVSAESPIFPGYTPLHFAVTYHSSDVFELLLKNGANVSLTDAKSLSPLHLIIKRNMELVLHKKNDSVWFFSDMKKELESNEKLINLLLENSIFNQWNSTDSIGLSRLHVVSTLQSTKLVEKAIEEGVDLQLTVNADSHFLPGHTALHLAAHFNSDIVKILLEKEGNLTAKDAKGVTPFDICLQRWNGYFIYDLVTMLSVWDDVMFSDNETRLIHFIDYIRSKRIITNFLKYTGVDVNAFVTHDSPIWPGYTFLHLATVFIGKTDFVDSDDEYAPGPDPLVPEDFRNTKIIRVCLKLGADPTIQDVHGTTALHLAFHMRKAVAVNEILKRCGNDKIVNPVDSNGLSHLHIACAAKKEYEDDYEDEEQESEEEVGENLATNMMSNGISPNCSLTSPVKWKNQYGEKVFLDVGWTPLHCAVATSNLRLIRILLEHGADVYAKDVNGLTPIHLILSTYYDFKNVGNVLLSSVNLKDSVADCGLSHLHAACYVKNASAVQKLLENGADTESVISYKRPMSCKHANDDAESDYSDDCRKFSYCDACDPFLEPLSFVSPFAGCTPLHVALKRFCSAEITGLLVQHGANVNTKKPDGKFPFYHTLDRDVHWWKLSIIPVLKSNEALQKCVREHTGITMLHVSCAILDLDAIVELLDSGADVNAKVHMDSPVWPGCSPLHLISHDHEGEERGDSTFQEFDKIANLLFEKGADVLCMNAQQNTPIHEVFHQFLRQFNYHFDDREANASFVALLVKNQKDFSVNPVDVTGVSHFHIACVCGDVKAVEEFLKHGVDVNSSVDRFSYLDGGFSVLHFAVIGQSKEVVDVLLKHGVDPNSSNCVDDTSLHLAVKFNLTNEDLFKSLMSAGADMSAKNLYGETPMDLIFKDYSNSEAVVVFLKHGVRVNVFDQRTNVGYIASVVAKETRTGILREPLFMAPICNPSVNDDDEMGRSPIHNIVSTDKVMISTNHYTKAIEEYVKAGFDIDRSDKKGRTALHLAMRFKNVEGITALLENGADINIKDNDCNTPFAYCFQFDQTSKRHEFEVFKVLTLHINKLQSFGLQVSHINRICDRTIGDQFPLVSKKFHNKEVSGLIKKKIDDSHSFVLLDFLSEKNVVCAYPTMPRVIRDAIDVFFQTSSDYLRKNFPNLACLLQLQYRKAKIRMTMIDSAKASLNFVSAVEIPDICSDIILRSLTNEDLSNLIQAASADWQPNKRIRLD